MSAGSIQEMAYCWLLFLVDGFGLSGLSRLDCVVCAAFLRTFGLVFGSSHIHLVCILDNK